MIRSKRINIKIIIAVILVLLFAIGITYFSRSKNSADSGKDFDYETKLFNKDKIMSVDIQIDEDTWDSMIENASSEEYVQCDVVVNGEKFSDVGIRPKGNTSLSQIVSDDTTDRFSFKIEFDHYIDGENCFGLDKLVLNNLMSDSTYMKEYLSYDLMNYSGVLTPLYSYASITVNGKEWGLYLALEAMEESFALRNYGTDYGQLYKPETTEMGGGMEDMADWKENMGQGMKMPDMPNGDESQTQQSEGDTAGQKQPPDMPDISESQQGGMHGFGGERGGIGGFGSSGGASLQYTDDEVDSYRIIFNSAVFDTTRKDYKKVIEAIKNLNEGTDLEKYVDIDANLKYIATNTVLVNLDSYFSNMQHNYYLYEQDGVITMLPWDYNLSFAGFQSGDATSAINFPIDTPVSGIEVSERPMIAKLLEVEEYNDLYHQYMKDIVSGYFDSGLYESRIEKVDKLISEYVRSDATAFYTYDEYKTGVENILQFGLLRAKSIQGQLDGTIPSTEEGQTADTSALIDASSVNLTAMGTQGGGGAGMQMGDKENVFNTNVDATNTANRDNANQDTANQDTANQDTANQDSATHDTMNQGKANQNNSVQDNSNNKNNKSLDETESSKPQVASDSDIGIPGFGNNQSTMQPGNTDDTGTTGDTRNHAGFSMGMTSNSDETSNGNIRSNLILYVTSGAILVVGLLYAACYRRRKHRS
ncbi:MAG TPA: CotH kinase family protein [Lachnospiraceae bacterium]|nr:CotH kinase family protein [Lachnospiraceae bacterium]